MLLKSTVSNKSINILETTMQEFKTLNIPFQYVLLNEDVLTDIRIMEFCENDNNVDVFSIERKIKIKATNNSRGKDKK